MKTQFLRLFFTALAVLAGTAAATEVEMHTDKGLLIIKVDEAKAPLTAANFLQYVRDGFYDGLIFHRVIPGFVVQGGGFLPTMQKRAPRKPIVNEAANGLKNLKYTLSMARTQNPDSATSQFFINLAHNVPLDYAEKNPGYAVFATVTTGQEVVDAIAAVKTGTFQHFRDVPQTPIVIQKAIVRVVK